MEKALKFLKHMKQTDTPYNFRECELDEAIAELEEAMDTKTCEGCFYWDSVELSVLKTISYCRFLNIGTKNNFGCNKFEPKDNA